MKYKVYYTHKVKLSKMIFSVDLDAHDCIIDLKKKKKYKEWTNSLSQALRPVKTDFTSLLLNLVLCENNFLWT